jgi:Flp pilus assembly protein TadD
MKRWLRYSLVLSALGVLQACTDAKARRDHYWQQGQQQMQRGNYPQAYIALRNALFIDPNNPELLVLVGESAEHSGRLREAAQRYQRAVNRHPQQVRAYARLARLNVLAGRTERARSLLTTALKIAPQDADLLTVRGLVRLRRGDDAGAYDDAVVAVTREPGNAQAVALLVALLQRSSMDRQADFALERALEVTPDNVELRLIKTQRLLASDQTVAAERLLRDTLKLEAGRSSFDERWAQLLDNEAWRLIQAGELDRAHSLLITATEHAPRSPLIRYHLGVLYLQRGERIAAKHSLELALATGIPFAGHQHAQTALAGLQSVR